MPIPQGICVSCIHTGSCIHLRRAGRAILHCDLFDVGPANRPLADTTTTFAAEIYERGKGLCGNCLHRNGCAMAAQPGGVWRCEEYL